MGLIVIQLFGLLSVALAQYSPDLITTAGLAPFDIFCIGPMPPQSIFDARTFPSPRYRDAREAASVGTLAQICDVYVGTWCAKKLDEKGQHVDLMFDELYWQLAKHQPPERDWRRVLVANNEKVNPFEAVSQVQALADYCHIKCKCGESAGPHAYSDETKLPSAPIFAPVNIFDFDPSATTPLEVATSTRMLKMSSAKAEWGLDLQDIGSSRSPRTARAIRTIAFQDPGRYGLRVVQAKQHNIPKCDNRPIPDFLYTTTETRTGYALHSARKLCLHRWAGGSRKVSFGGVCLPNGPERKRGLFFEDRYRAPELSSDYRWASSAQETEFIARLESFCREACRCPSDALSNFNRLKILLKSSKGEGEEEIDPPSPSYLGLVRNKKERLVSERISRLWSSSSKERTCGLQECYGPYSCGETCSCRAQEIVTSLQSTQREWTASCMSFTVVDYDRSNGRLGSRGADMMRPCPCNATYVSFGCCDSSNGLVWERTDMKLGRLS